MGAQAYGSTTAFVLPTCHDDEMWIGHGYSRHYSVSRVHINFPDIFHFYFLNLCIRFFFIFIVAFSLTAAAHFVCVCASIFLVQCQLCCSSRRLHVGKSIQKSALLYIRPTPPSHLLILVGSEEITPVFFLKRISLKKKNSFLFAFHCVWRFRSPSFGMPKNTIPIFVVNVYIWDLIT